jgi:F-type H+-transporting ATPase subunit b
MRRLLRILVVLLALAGAAAFAVQTNEPSVQAQPTQTEPQKEQTTSAGPRRAGQELAEESKKAEGEGNEEEAFMFSASVRWFAEHTGLSKEAAYWLFLVINFVIVAWFIVWAWKKSVPTMFRMRTQSIQHGMQEARVASEDAQRRLADVEARLAKLDSEIEAMRAAAERDGAVEEQRLKASAEEERKRIVDGTEQEIAAVAKQMRGDLKRYASELAIGLAEKKIQVTPADDEALLRRFTEQLAKDGKE